MSTTSQVILILGAGSNIGRAVAASFVSKGYKVALAARSLKEEDSSNDQLNIKSDFSKPEDIVQVFDKVKTTLGAPSVVVYNAGALSPSPPDDPFAVPLEAFNRDMSINTTSVYVAAQQAVRGFAELPNNTAKSFFFTGNILNVTSIPGFMSSGAGKSASAHLMMAAAAAYKDRGYKFYYVDERKVDGSAKYKVDGEAHAKLMLELVEASTQGPWMQTFVKDLGYKSFESHYHM